MESVDHDARGDGRTGDQPAHAVAIRTPFNGLVYFDQSERQQRPRNWLINQTPRCCNAFKTGINKQGLRRRHTRQHVAEAVRVHGNR